MRTRNIIAEIGLRFPPTLREDRDGHAARVALLAKDVAHVPEAQLADAVAEWVRTKSFMPKASELIGLAREIQQRRRGGKDVANGQRLADLYNAQIDADPERRKRGLMWRYNPDTDALYLKAINDRAPEGKLGGTKEEAAAILDRFGFAPKDARKYDNLRMPSQDELEALATEFNGFNHDAEEPRF